MVMAAFPIHHPTTLEHEISSIESGKVVQTTINMIRLEKSDGAAVGCGGHIIFKETGASSNSNTYSELYCYVDYNGKNKGTCELTRNDLNLKATHRWVEESEMIIEVETV